MSVVRSSTALWVSGRSMGKSIRVASDTKPGCECAVRDAEGTCGPLAIAKMDEIRGGNMNDEAPSGDAAGIPKF